MCGGSVGRAASLTEDDRAPHSLPAVVTRFLVSRVIRRASRMNQRTTMHITNGSLRWRVDAKTRCPPAIGAILNRCKEVQGDRSSKAGPAFAIDIGWVWGVGLGGV